MREEERESERERERQLPQSLNVQCGACTCIAIYKRSQNDLKSHTNQKTKQLYANP